MSGRILVLGGGAAGIVSAISAAEAAPEGTRVTLLERNPRVGKKLLATGNGRCNLDNTGIRPRCYTTSDESALRPALDTVNAAAPLEWFQSHGLLTRSDEAGRVYPYSNQAADVLNLLLYWLERTGVEVRTECVVTDVAREKHGFLVSTETEETFRADAVICAFGGQAGPKFGSDGFSAELAKKLGLRVQPEYPCLVPLACEKSRISGLSGIRVKAAVTLTDGDAFLSREEGEVQFTDQGLSGIAVMQMSNFLKPKGGPRRPVLHLNLFPQMKQAQLLEVLRQRVELLRDTDCGALMTGFVHHRIGAAVWKAAGLGTLNRPAASLKEQDLQTLARAFQDWTFPDPTPLGWQQAQTTGGGISLREIDPENFSLRSCPGLYFVGESLDCAGQCGGFNLHWAFGSGIAAGRHAAAERAGTAASGSPAPGRSHPPKGGTAPGAFTKRSPKRAQKKR